MTNEPVAYIDPYDLERLPHYDCYIGSQQLKNGIPLYTHPAKTLTDEEIAKFTVRIYNCRTGAEAHEIVLAILRKASEK